MFLVDKMDQKNCLKLCYKNGLRCSSVLVMMNIALKDFSMSKKNVYHWPVVSEVNENNESPKCPSTTATDKNVKKMNKMIINDPISDVADEVGISIGLRMQFF